MTRTCSASRAGQPVARGSRARAALRVDHGPRDARPAALATARRAADSARAPASHPAAESADLASVTTAVRRADPGPAAMTAVHPATVTSAPLPAVTVTRALPAMVKSADAAAGLPASEVPHPAAERGGHRIPERVAAAALVRVPRASGRVAANLAAHPAAEIVVPALEKAAVVPPARDPREAVRAAGDPMDRRPVSAAAGPPARARLTPERAAGRLVRAAAWVLADVAQTDLGVRGEATDHFPRNGPRVRAARVRRVMRGVRAAGPAPAGPARRAAAANRCARPAS